MAIYQFQLTVIPKKGVFEKFGLIPEKLEIDYEERKTHHFKKEGLIDEEDKFYDALTQDWWSSAELNPIEIIHQVDKIVSRANYGNDTWVVWKTYSHELDNDASMSINAETGKIEEFQFRADLREQDLKFLQNMISLSNKYDWLLMDIRGNLSKPALKEVSRLIQASNSQ
jgi:hypothetical protein